MVKGRRKIKYFTEAEAEKFWQTRALDDMKTGMAGSRWTIEEDEPGQFYVQQWVIGQRSSAYAKSGILPYDTDPDYLEGYHAPSGP